VEPPVLDELGVDTVEMGRGLLLDRGEWRDWTLPDGTLRASTDRAIVALFGGNLFEMGQMLYGMERYLAELALHPEACLRLSEALTKVQLHSCGGIEPRQPSSCTLAKSSSA
jgi:hypothetical protein